MQRDDLDEAILTAMAHSLGRVAVAGDTLLMAGPLGVGKTTFARAFARGLGVDHPERVRSPTFNLCLVHDGRIPFAHLDLFRFASEDGSTIASAALEALDLGSLGDIRGSEAIPSGAVVLVEWSDAWSDAPEDALRIRLAYAGPDRRDLRAEAGGSRSQAVLNRWIADVAQTCREAEKTRNR